MRIKSNKNEDYFIMQRKISIISLAAELPNFIMSVIAAVASKTVLVWTDTLLSFSNIIHPSLIIIVLSGLIRDWQDTKYNYGTARIEVFAAFGCDFLVLFGLIVLGTVSVISIVNPTPVEHIGWFVLLKILNVSVDIYLLVQQIRLKKKQKTTIYAAEMLNYTMNTVSDGILLFCSVLCFILRQSALVMYISPFLSVIVCIYFIIIYLRQMKDAVSELTDRSEQLIEQDRIYDIILDDHSLLKSLHFVNMHRLRGDVYVDIYADFKESSNMEEVQMWLDSIQKIIQADKDECYHVSLVLESRTKMSGDGI